MGWTAIVVAAGALYFNLLRHCAHELGVSHPVGYDLLILIIHKGFVSH